MLGREGVKPEDEGCRKAGWLRARKETKTRQEAMEDFGKGEEEIVGEGEMRCPLWSLWVFCS